MHYKEIISPMARIGCDIFEGASIFEGEAVTQYGVKVMLFIGDVTVSTCSIPDISDDYDFVSVLAKEITDRRIPPSEALAFVEDSLPK